MLSRKRGCRFEPRFFVQNPDHRVGARSHRLHVRLAVHRIQHECNFSANPRSASPSSISRSDSTTAIHIRPIPKLPHTSAPISHTVPPLPSKHHTYPAPSVHVHDLSHQHGHRPRPTWEKVRIEKAIQRKWQHPRSSSRYPKSISFYC